MNISTIPFGEIDGRQITLFTLANDYKMSLKITNYGGIVTSIQVPDRSGNIEDVVLGFDNLDDYCKNEPYFGAIIGRFANRIAGGTFNIENKHYKLTRNHGNIHLHGGEKGFDKVIWQANEIKQDDVVGIRLIYNSPDKEEGYPGNVDVEVTYELANSNEFRITYRATTNQPTHVNLTQHSYFNLSGDPDNDILNNYLWIDANRYTEVNSDLIPTGKFINVSGTPFDFTQSRRIGCRIDQIEGGYDHNFEINNSGNALKKAAIVRDSKSGRKMEVFTTQPGLQFYTANFGDKPVRGKNNRTYKNYSGFCLEAQHFPDTPNQPAFPSTLLKPGELYLHKTIYRFGITS
ncbi:MAG: galactose mutarotase [Bacteroidales bacterium]|nr:galactose mutarotase [Bacteroidales bacterium]